MVSVVNLNSNMEQLPTYRRVLVWFSVSPPPENSTNWEKFSFLIFTITNITLLASGSITSIILLLQSKTFDLVVFLYVLFQIVASGSMIYVVMAALISRNIFNDLFVDL